MTTRLRKLLRNSRGAAALEFAIAVPALIVMIWGLFQVALMFQANAGIQQALGEAARAATIFPTPTDTQLQAQITSHKFGVGNGTWATPTITTNAGAGTKTITVSYSQPTDFLFFQGPSITITKSKVVYLSQ
jgi:Flp pilus assembly protein TadG